MQQDEDNGFSVTFESFFQSPDHKPVEMLEEVMVQNFSFSFPTFYHHYLMGVCNNF